MSSDDAFDPPPGRKTVSLDLLTHTIEQLLCELHGGELPVAFDADTRILELGLVDSFGLMDFAFKIEKSLELCVDEDALLPEDFESARVLWERLRILSDK